MPRLSARENALSDKVRGRHLPPARNRYRQGKNSLSKGVFLLNTGKLAEVHRVKPDGAEFRFDHERSELQTIVQPTQIVGPE